MSVYLARTLLLSLGISLFITACFYMIREDGVFPQLHTLEKSVTTYTAAFILQPSPPSSGKHPNIKRSLEKNMAITSGRLERAKYDYEIKSGNDSTYRVTVKGIKDTISIRELIAGNCRVSFNEVYSVEDLKTAVLNLNKAWDSVAKDIVPDSPELSLFNFLNTPEAYENIETGRQMFPAYIGWISQPDADLLMKVLSQPKALAFFPADTRFVYGDFEYNQSEAGDFKLLYAVRENRDALSHRNITEALPDQDENNQPMVSMKFDAAGTARWARMTERNVGKCIAIIINDKVITAPNVLSRIEGGQSRISLPGHPETSNALSVMLTSEELPLPVQITGTEISPSLEFGGAFTGSPWLKYLLLFCLASAMSFSIIWFIFRPGKKA